MEFIKRRSGIMQTERSWSVLEGLLIILPSLFPLFFNLPYRINIFLSWEGAYRMYLGQVPYADFGLPLGFGFWLIPTLFFKIFGPYLFTLVEAQVFINIISLIAFRNILKLLHLDAPKRILAILIMVVSYSFPSFWPWYNHSVFVFQLISFNLLLLAAFSNKAKFRYLFIILSGLFAFLAFFTKQDSGAIAIAFGGILLLYHALATRSYTLLAIYFLSVSFFAAISILPFLRYDFGYWFNLGQEPHNSRISTYSFLNKLFSESEWAKFYLLMIGIAFWNHFEKDRIFKEIRYNLFFLITLGVILQAIIVRVTSPLTPDEQNYFHAFSVAFILGSLNLRINLSKIPQLTVVALLLVLWWSPLFWDYAGRVFKIAPPAKKTEENFSAIQTQWTTSDLKGFENILMPEGTIKGIKNILELDIIKKGGKNLRVLNMTELTPLALEIGYTPLTNQPLWFHLNIGIFQKEIDEINNKIKGDEYDLVLFQSIPGLDNFFPYEIQSQLKENYHLYDTFEAPRKRSEGYSFIEVYVKGP